MYKIITPKTEEQLNQYFHFRWQVLREPFNLPLGSEKDEYDSIAQHRMLLNDEDQIVAVGRLHFNTREEVQIRHIAVKPEYHGRGLGRILMLALENYAISENATRAVTNSLETSESFFSQCGFIVEESAPRDLTKLKRLHMVKQLGRKQRILLHPKWCKALQTTWMEAIPISEQMGIKVHQYDGFEFEVRASLNKNVNIHGTMFAGSIYSLATLTGWGMIHLQLKQKGFEGDIVLGDGQIHYHKPVTNKPRGIVDLDSFEADFNALTSGQKAKVSLTVKIMDNATPVAEFVGKYWVLPIPPEAPTA